ncbi:MAG TPA: 3-oxoacyl-[acyl-carrier-protein] synthase III C-terminal domain-containing protein [Nocardioidaceae bacterium]|nr:3-oxoacyl-[acyl-carrier-protein] synthase III C-terminal domain-containing protein [Nocardioidaceae bacterium]
MPVYLTATGSYLPGEAVANDEIESRLGLVAGKPSPYRALVLDKNGITQRHYAVDADGKQTHLNEELAAHAVGAALDDRGIGLDEVGLLAVGTTIPDVLMPGFGSMVHGRLARNGHSAPLEVLTTAGICASGASALQHAWTAVLAGRHERAVVAGSELASVMMKSSRFEREGELASGREDVPAGFEYFNADFLRWMLSDGAGSAVLETSPHPSRLSLRVDWIELTSYAHELDVCMHLGTSDPTDVSVGKTWLGARDAVDAHEQGMLVVRQDVKLLARNMMATGKRELERLIANGRIDAELGYDWFLPHLSSYFFADKTAKTLADAGLDLPTERWFTNLATKGNTGSASIFVILDEALRSGLFKPGERILAFVPESGRFIASFMQFTVVGPESAPN